LALQIIDFSRPFDDDLLVIHKIVESVIEALSIMNDAMPMKNPASLNLFSLIMVRVGVGHEASVRERAFRSVRLAHPGMRSELLKVELGLLVDVCAVERGPLHH